MHTSIAKIKESLKELEGQYIDVVLYPNSAYRMTSYKNARICNTYERFFTIEVKVNEESYQTSINYIDIYTQSAKITKKGNR